MVFGVSRHDVTKVLSTSYGLLLFSSKVGPHPEEDVGLPSVSVGEFWPEIDLLDGVNCRGTSTVPARGPLGQQMRAHTWTPMINKIVQG
jgi:hypothetical protein